MNKIETLEDIFIQAFDDKKYESKFYYELLENDVYVLGSSEQEDLFDEGNCVKIVALKENDEVQVPLFLSKKSLMDFTKDSYIPYMKVLGKDVLELIQDSNVVINPGQKDTLVFYPEEIKEIIAVSKN